MILKILDNRKVALLYHNQTKSKYTKVKRINNEILGFITVVFLLISNFIDFYILIFSPFYILFVIIINILDYRIRKRQLRELINEIDQC